MGISWTFDSNISDDGCDGCWLPAVVFRLNGVPSVTSIVVVWSWLWLSSVFCVLQTRIHAKQAIVDFVPLGHKLRPTGSLVGFAF